MGPFIKKEELSPTVTRSEGIACNDLNSLCHNLVGINVLTSNRERERERERERGGGLGSKHTELDLQRY